jgi:hypothetical protein
MGAARSVERCNVKLKSCCRILTNVSKLPIDKYATEFRNLHNQVRSYNYELKKYVHYFAVSSIIEANIFGDVHVINKTVSYCDGAIKQIDAKIEKAESILSASREVALATSFMSAKEQFIKANKSIIYQLMLWGILSISFITAFFIVSYYMTIDYKAINNPIVNIKHIAVLFINKFIILSALGVLSAYSLKILRSHLHIKHLNDHRMRLMNIMPVLIESPNMQTTREIVVKRILDAVATFGSSGLIDKDPQSLSPSVTLEQIANQEKTK